MIRDRDGMKLTNENDGELYEIRDWEVNMVDINISEGQEDESSPLILRTQTYADLRQIAKRNLREAERVLAESGYRLLKDTQSGGEAPNQLVEEPSPEAKAEEREAREE